jgi:hypothetical protein
MKKSFLQPIIAILILAGAANAWCDELDQKGPFEVQLKQPDDEVQVTIEKVVVDIRSPRGISSAVLKRSSGGWPESIVLRLHLKGLEGFQIRTEKHALKLFVSSRPQPEIGLAKVNLETGEEAKLEKDSEWWIPLKRVEAEVERENDTPVDDDYFEIPLPKKLLDSNPETITLNWIDFYR